MHNVSGTFIERPVANQSRSHRSLGSKHDVPNLTFSESRVPNSQLIDDPMPIFRGERKIHTDIEWTVIRAKRTRHCARAIWLRVQIITDAQTIERDCHEVPCA